jgi:hypothetical protein
MAKGAAGNYRCVINTGGLGQRIGPALGQRCRGESDPSPRPLHDGAAFIGALHGGCTDDTRQME